MGLFRKKPSYSQLALFCNQIEVMQDSGMPIIRSLEILENQVKNEMLFEALGQMITRAKKGDTLSSIMLEYPKVFPTIMYTMVKAGETSGSLQKSFKKLEEHYEQKDAINSEIKKAMIYPIVLIVLSVVAVTFLLIFVLPTITAMFTDSGTALPIPTQIVMAMSDFLIKYWYLLLIGITIFVIGMKKWTSQGKGKEVKDSFLSKLPIVGKNINIIVTARFTRAMATLLSSGVPILESIKLSVEIADNTVLSKKMDYVLLEIQKGMSFGLLLRQIDFFPDMMISMVQIGEESGAMSELLGKASKYYDKELKKSLNVLVGLLEPMAIIFMGIIIGAIVIAMMLPMFDMIKTVG